MEKLVAKIVEAIQDKKGENIVSLDLRGFDGAIADAFVICSAASTTQVSAIADGIDEKVHKDTGEKVWRTEGLDNCLWVAMDYGNVMVHIFENETRDFYRLEQLWGDAKTTKYTDEN